MDDCLHPPLMEAGTRSGSKVAAARYNRFAVARQGARSRATSCCPDQLLNHSELLGRFNKTVGALAGGEAESAEISSDMPTPDVTPTSAKP